MMEQIGVGPADPAATAFSVTACGPVSISSVARRLERRRAALFRAAGVDELQAY